MTSIIANGLARRGYDVMIVSICGDNTCYYALEPSIKLHTLINGSEVDNKKQFFTVLKKLDRYYADNHIDIVVDVFAALSIYSILLKHKHHYKNITWEHFNYLVNVGMNRIGRQLAVRFSDQIITLSNTDKSYYQDNNRIKGSIDAIYNPSPYQDAVLDTEKKPILISVGRLTYQKGFDYLVEIWKKIESQCNWELLIFGDGEEKESLQEQIRNAGLTRIKLMGAVKNIDKYYKQASLYVSTARFEGLPMTMIEAQSFGLPIISFDYDTGPREIITQGSDGFIINRAPENEMIDETAVEIMKLMNDSNLRDQMSRNALIAANRFREEAIFDQWVSVLDRLL